MGEDQRAIIIKGQQELRELKLKAQQAIEAAQVPAASAEERRATPAQSSAEAPEPLMPSLQADLQPFHPQSPVILDREDERGY